MKVETITNYKIELSEQEATYIKFLVQNSFEDNEPIENKNLRESIWSVLNQAGVKL